MNQIHEKLGGQVGVRVFACVCVVVTLCTGVLAAQPSVPTTRPATQPATQPGRATPTFARQMADFAVKDAQSPPPANPTVFIGASSFTLWKQIPSTFKEFDAINRAFGGSRLADLIEHLDEVVVQYKPRAVVIWGGNSDITSGESVDQVFDTYRTLVERIHAALPETQVFCLSIIPAPSRAKNVEKLDLVSDRLRGFAEKQPYVHYIDARYVLSDADRNPDPSNYLADQLHPNAQGYAKLAPVIHQSLHEVLDAKPKGE